MTWPQVWLLFDGYMFNHPSPEEQKDGSKITKDTKVIKQRPIGAEPNEDPRITEYRCFLSLDPMIARNPKKLEAKVNAYKRKLQKEAEGQ